MKKLLTLLLALSLVLSMAACGSKTNDTAPDSTEDQQTQETNDQPQEAEEPSAPEAKELVGVTIPAFTVMVGEKEITDATMAEYAVYEVQTTSVNSAGTESTSTYVGFALSDVLTAAGITEYQTVTATADDDYAVEVDGTVAAEPTTLLAISKDGEQFKTSPWFAPCSSGTTGDYLKGMVALSVDGAEAVLPSAEGEEETTAPDGAPEIADRTDKVEFAPYSFLVNGTEVTNDTLEGLSIYKIDAQVTNKKGEQKVTTYTGYRLSDVLAAAGVTEYTTVKAVANDGYETALELETANSEYTLLAIERDKEVGEDGTVWVAPCLEQEASAYPKLVVEIVAE